MNTFAQPSYATLGPRFAYADVRGLGPAGRKNVFELPPGGLVDVYVGAEAVWVGVRLELWARIRGIDTLAQESMVRVPGFRHVMRASGQQVDGWVLWVANDGAAIGEALRMSIAACVDDRPVTSSLVDPALGAEAIVPADAGIHEYKSLYVGNAGNVRVNMKGIGTQVDFANAEGFLPLQTTRVWNAGTTATGIIGLL